MIHPMARDLERFLTLPSDPLRNAALAVSTLVLLAGLIVLARQVPKVLRGEEASPPLPAFRMLATLGALCGFVVYLRDQPSPGARWGLLLGGLSAAAWYASVAVHLLAKRVGRRRR